MRTAFAMTTAGAICARRRTPSNSKTGSQPPANQASRALDGASNGVSGGWQFDLTGERAMLAFSTTLRSLAKRRLLRNQSIIPSRVHDTVALT